MATKNPQTRTPQDDRFDQKQQKQQKQQTPGGGGNIQNPGGDPQKPMPGGGFNKPTTPGGDYQKKPQIPRQDRSDEKRQEPQEDRRGPLEGEEE